MRGKLPRKFLVSLEEVMNLSNRGPVMGPFFMKTEAFVFTIILCMLLLGYLMSKLENND